MDACECCLCVFIIKGPVTIVSGPPYRFHCHHCHLIASLKDIISTSNHIPIYQRLEISTDEIFLDNIIQDICSMKSGFIFRIIYHQRESQLRHSFILSPSFPLSLTPPFSPYPSPFPSPTFLLSLPTPHTFLNIIYFSHDTGNWFCIFICVEICLLCLSSFVHFQAVAWWMVCSPYTDFIVE